MLRNLPVLVLALSASAFAQTTGHVFTRNSSGAIQNGNLYAQKADVYVAAGPGPSQPCTAAGLPDGQYYFQVTDPSGQTLLSEDPIENRAMVVAGGVCNAHNGSHLTGSGPCGSTIVQLLPFGDSLSSGEYKVWATPVAAYDPFGGGFFGFLPRYSKTDNFKVGGGGGSSAPQSVISGFAFFDHSEDGSWNPGVDPLEVPVAGWRVEILRGGLLDGVTYTDESGRYTFLRDLDHSSWTIREIAPGGFIGDGVAGAIWLAKTPRTGTVTTDNETVAGPDFGVLSFEVKPGVGRSKGFWHGRNGRNLLLQCEPLWRDVLTTFAGAPLGLRRNVSSADPLQSLYVPPPLPATFDAAFADFSSWIIGDPSLGHAGFMLSTQLAAAILSSRCGFMQFTVYVDAHQDGILVSFDDLVREVTPLLNDPLAGLTGPRDPGQALRQQMLVHLKTGGSGNTDGGVITPDEFGSINGTGDLSEPQVVYGTSSTPKGFRSPYSPPP